MGEMVAERERLLEMTERIIDAAMKVHTALGPGLLESVYEACLESELVAAGFEVERQRPLPVVYRDVSLDCGYRLDLVVADSVLVELKAVDTLADIHSAQIITYLKLSGYKVGLLINFNVTHLRNGIRRHIHSL